MAARIRVYELARELGLTNKETLDLCIALGIGVKSHSSSIEDAQADRVRRKADREGLRRDVQPPEEPMPGRPGAPEASPAAPPQKRDLRLITSRPASEQIDPGSYGQTYGQTAQSHRPAPDGGTSSPAAPAAEGARRDGGSGGGVGAGQSGTGQSSGGQSVGGQSGGGQSGGGQSSPVQSSPGQSGGGQSSGSPSTGAQVGGGSVGGGQSGRVPATGPGPVPADPSSAPTVPAAAAQAPVAPVRPDDSGADAGRTSLAPRPEGARPEGPRPETGPGQPGGAPSPRPAQPAYAPPVTPAASSGPAAAPSPSATGAPTAPGRPMSPSAPSAPSAPPRADGSGRPAGGGASPGSATPGSGAPAGSGGPGTGGSGRPNSGLPTQGAPAARGPGAPGGAPTGPRPGGPSGAPGSSPIAARPAAPRPAPPASASPGASPRPAAPGAPGAPGAAGGPPRSATGKAIPPPPGTRPGGPPRSASGKPIPPPPGLGGRTPPPPQGPARFAGPGGSRPSGGPGARPTGGPTGGPGARPTGGPGAGRPAGAGAGRPGGGFGGPRPGGGPGGGPGAGARPGGFGAPGAGRGPGGGPGGGPPGRGGPGANRGRPPQRRRRRRRSFEELEATPSTTYTRSDAPIPEGEVVIERGSTAQELGPKLNRTAADVVRFLFQQGEMITATQSLSDDMIELFAAEVSAEVLLVDPGQEQEVELQGMLRYDDDEDEEALRPRPPVITVMGHVDHGKTLLLDRIRETNVVATEAGGITQHIGAYQVEKGGRLITFIDTPGHEAFTAMRARGAEATDIAVLVVAADDGVMPQTIEALNHAKAADVPIVVAINKIDRENADPNRVRQQLSDHGLVPEEWGGDTIMVELSALQNYGVDDLLEQLLVVADVEELVANPEGRARGVVLETNLDVGRGPVATVLVERGMLQVGDPIVAGAAWGRVRALIDHTGENVKEAPPSTPVQVLGLNDVPRAGDEFRVAPNDKIAKTVAAARAHRYRLADLRKSSSVIGSGARLEDIFEQIQRGETATLNLILKADVHGSLEALTESLKRLERDEVKLAFLMRAVGGITENDVQLATASNATIIGFNVRPDRNARELAETNDVEIRTYQIIYQILEDIEKAMVGLLKPEFVEVVTGEAEVREVFRVPRIGAVAGCYVRNGVITRGSKVRFLREGVVIWTGSITSLKRFKDDAREVATGFECGIGLSDFQDLKGGDIIETYEEREVPRT